VVAAERDVWHKGHALFEAMRKEFLKADPAADLAGYDVNQGAFSTLLETGKYNCVSFRHVVHRPGAVFRPAASGVQLPSYTFVQLTAADNKIIEIETTAGNGFDWIHDENFYKAKALTWFLSRAFHDRRMKITRSARSWNRTGSSVLPWQSGTSTPQR